MADIINVICPCCHSPRSLNSKGGLGEKKYNLGLNPKTETFILVQASTGGGGQGNKTKGKGFITKEKLTFGQALRDVRFKRIAERVRDSIGMTAESLEE